MIEIEVINWEKYNPRSDYHCHWFKLDARLLDDPQLIDLDCEEMMILITVFTITCQMQGKPWIVNERLISFKSRAPLKKVFPTIKKLEQFHIVRCTERNRYETVTDPIAHNSTLQDITEQNITEQNRTYLVDSDAVHPLVLVWNENCGTLPRVNVCSGSRLRNVKARWRERPDIEWWRGLIKKMASLPFMNGDNDRGWVGSFDFILNPTKLAKLEEGVYDTLGTKTKAQQVTDKTKSQMERVLKGAL